jgi:hypothetical protein
MRGSWFCFCSSSQQAKFLGSEGQDVSIYDIGALDPDAVHEGTLGAVLIGDQELALLFLNDGMMG